MQMEKATWGEIKALALDFKRTQATSSNLKLTERNCIDIINYLCVSKQLSLYFTTDGKTFLTPQELEKEIYEELEISNDRIELTKLCSILDLDFQIIENVTNKMVNNDSNLQIIMGCLINSSYIRAVALKINETVKEKGRLNILDLTRLFNLPKPFIEKLIENNLTSLIEAQKDGDALYTNNFIRRHYAMIRGYLTRSSKPVNISFLTQKFSVSEKLTIKIILELIDSKRISGKLEQNKSIFVPDVHLKNKKLYFQGFFDQNNYLDFSTMKEVGIQNPAKFVEVEFPGVTILSSCALGDGIISQLEVAIQDCDKSESFFSCYQIVPSIVKQTDLLLLVEKFIKKFENLFIVGSDFVVSGKFISKCVSNFDEMIKLRAEDYVKKNRKSISSLLSDHKMDNLDPHDQEDHHSSKGVKISKFKSGGGTQGREIRVKTVKNKYIPEGKDKKPANKKSSQSSSLTNPLEFITENEAVEFLVKVMFPSGGDDQVQDSLLRDIFGLIDRQLQTSFKQACQQVLLHGVDSAQNKAEHQRFVRQLGEMVNKLRTLECGLEEIACTEPLRPELARYALKTVGADLVQLVCERLAADHDVPWDSAATATATALADSRARLMQAVSRDLVAPTKALIRALKDEQSAFDGLFGALETVCDKLGAALPKRLDKKTEKVATHELVAQYRGTVTAKIDAGEQVEPSELLLATVVVLFHRVTGRVVHASGKSVPALIEFLRRRPESDALAVDWDTLVDYQLHVMALLRADPADRPRLKEARHDLHTRVLEIALGGSGSA